ncbi:MAG TPA: ABC transporter permease subunit [Candidatus Caldiarchaeum subterraneum]|uniref:ABC transporter permease subunit n=1 Tax=Caldiarchaeum subterraneum TaxID=311458 RepID=A0A833EA38_CALS0|nr:ABC transporter permease subunit [Candidatus Caldarchaeum subterraneum]
MPYQEVATIIARSIMVSGLATLLALAWSIPVIVKLLATGGRVAKIALDVAGTLTGIPTVVLGLLLYFLLSRGGPLGFLGILYSPLAMILGQALLITPYIIYLAVSNLMEGRRNIWELALSLGASKTQAALTLLQDGVYSLASVVVVAFNRAVGELGIALMLGGNIKGFTRVMTTAIALEVSKGEYELALTLGGALLAIVLPISIAITTIGKKI